jgi:hypothetical protein
MKKGSKHSAESKAKMSKAKEKAWQNSAKAAAMMKGRPYKQEEYRARLSKSVQECAAERRGRSRPQLTVRGGGPPVSKLSIAQLLLSGHTYPEIAKELGRSMAGVQYHAGRMGLIDPKLAGGTRLHSFGEIFDAPKLLELLRATGLTKRQFAKQIGVKHGAILRYSGTRRTSGSISRKLARKATEWRARVLRQLLSNARGYDPSAVLRTFFPNIAATHDLLGAGLASLAYWRAKGAVAGLGEQICQKAVEEIANPQEHPRRTFPRSLPLLVELLPHFEEKLSRKWGRHPAQEGSDSSYQLGHTILAEYFGTKPSAVRYAIEDEKTIAPQRMALLLTQSAAQATWAEASAKVAAKREADAPQPAKSGKKRGAPPREESFWRQAQELQHRGLTAAEVSRAMLEITGVSLKKSTIQRELRKRRRERMLKTAGAAKA